MYLKYSDNKICKIKKMTFNSYSIMKQMALLIKYTIDNSILLVLE